MTTARELLRSCPSVQTNVTVGEMIDRLQHDDAFFAVVNDTGRLVGLVTEYDLVKLVHESGVVEADAVVGNFPAYLGWSKDQLRALTAAEVMTTDPQTVSPDADLDRLIDDVFKNERKVLPVVEHGQVLGVVRRTDVLKKVLG